MWYTCLTFFCFVHIIFCTNYTYYDGFAYKITNTTTINQTMSSCVCQCLLTNGCAALNYYNGTKTCSLVYDTNITESDVTMNTTAALLLVSASLSYS